jgi:hypothetical protein
MICTWQALAYLHTARRASIVTGGIGGLFLPLATRIPGSMTTPVCSSLFWRCLCSLFSLICCAGHMASHSVSISGYSLSRRSLLDLWCWRNQPWWLAGSPGSPLLSAGSGHRLVGTRLHMPAAAKYLCAAETGCSRGERRYLLRWLRKPPAVGLGPRVIVGKTKVAWKRASSL